MKRLKQYMDHYLHSVIFTTLKTCLYAMLCLTREHGNSARFRMTAHCDICFYNII